MEQPKYENLTKEAQQQVQADVDAVLAKHGAEIVIAPVITPQGTIGAVAQVFKKTLPEAGTLSPFVPQSEATNERGAADPESSKPASEQSSS